MLLRAQVQPWLGIENSLCCAARQRLRPVQHHGPATAKFLGGRSTAPSSRLSGRRLGKRKAGQKIQCSPIKHEPESAKLRLLDFFGGADIVMRRYGGLPAIHQLKERVPRKISPSVTPDTRLDDSKSVLSAEAQETLRTHPALGNPLTQSVFLEALFTTETAKADISALLHLLASSPLASQVTAIFSRTCFPWVPIEDWKHVVQTIAVIVNKWETSLKGASEFHPAWRWLEMFASLRSVEQKRPPKFCL